MPLSNKFDSPNLFNHRSLRRRISTLLEQGTQNKEQKNKLPNLQTSKLYNSPLRLSVSPSLYHIILQILIQTVLLLYHHHLPAIHYPIRVLFRIDVYIVTSRWHSCDIYLFFFEYTANFQFFYYLTIDIYYYQCTFS